jgi:prepilin-type N-terminal cleavage/methylation domain-containing protein
MTRRARTEGGFTVVELLVAMVVLSIVAFGAMTLIEVVMRQGRGVVDRTEAAQRGRLVLDQMTRQIRSQVCLNATTQGLISAAPNSISFYADLSAEGTSPRKRTLEYRPSSRQLVERVYQPNGTTVARDAVLLQNVVPVTPNTGVFSYSAYPQSPAPGTEVSPSETLTGGPALTAEQVARIAVVGSASPSGRRAPQATGSTPT